MSSVQVIVPCFNYGGLLAECVGSVLAQRDVDVQVLIVDDQSTDETPEVGRALAAADARVAFRRHDRNRGHIATYNEALAEVDADYCMILSADDMLAPGALGRAVRCMDARPNVGLTYGRDLPFRGRRPVYVAPAGEPAVRCISYRDFLAAACQRGDTGIQAPTAVVRTAVQRRAGFYRHDLPHTADTEIWLRLAALAAVAELDAVQAFRRLHKTNMSLSYSPLRRLQEQKRAFDIHLRGQRASMAEAEALRAIAHRTFAEAAFWMGARAFDAGDARLCRACLAFASRTAPALAHTDVWRRMQWKWRIGVTAWRLLQPLADRARQLTRGMAAASPRSRAH